MAAEGAQDDPVRFERDGPVVVLTLNRPGTRNALTDADMLEALLDACARVEADASVRAVILTGAGPAFCSGGNIKHMRDKAGLFAGSPAEIREGYRAGIQRVPKALWALSVPTIAAVNGPAYGAGCDLTLMCDIRIAAEEAVFAENFVKVGLIAGDGGAWFLPRQIGLSRAAEMALTGEPVDARTALEWGLVSRVVEGGQLIAEAKALAGRIAANPPAAVRMTKRLLREGLGVDLPVLLEMAAAYQALAHHTEDHAEAVAAFLDKRDPAFKGR